ncbi:hypothetical protein, partial [Cryobacterium frigoriphilum]|uniref:hypothetical protein n=1 Tax=Cryobacterium frigoriphilum TaxID=1259150 RepID=UPI00141BF0AA
AQELVPPRAARWLLGAMQATRHAMSVRWAPRRDLSVTQRQALRAPRTKRLARRRAVVAANLGALEMLRSVRLPAAGDYRAAVSIWPSQAGVTIFDELIVGDPESGQPHAADRQRPWRALNPVHRHRFVRISALRAVSLLCAVPLVGAGLGAGALVVGQATSTLAVFTTAVTADRAVSVPVALQPTAASCAFVGSALTVSFTAPAAGAPAGGYLVTLEDAPSATPPTSPSAGQSVTSSTTTVVLDDRYLAAGVAYPLTVSAVPFSDWLASTALQLTLDSAGGVTCA